MSLVYTPGCVGWLCVCVCVLLHDGNIQHAVYRFRRLVLCGPRKTSHKQFRKFCNEMQLLVLSRSFPRMQQSAYCTRKNVYHYVYLLNDIHGVQRFIPRKYLFPRKSTLRFEKFLIKNLRVKRIVDPLFEIRIIDSEQNTVDSTYTP